MPLFAKRVNASATSSTWTSVSTASVDLANRKTVSTIPRSSRDGSRSTRSDFLPRLVFLGRRPLSLFGKSRSDPHVAKTRRSCAVSRAHGLHWLPLAAVRCTPQRPVVKLADRVTRIPELRCDSAVARILDHPHFFSALV